MNINKPVGGPWYNNIDPGKGCDFNYFRDQYKQFITGNPDVYRVIDNKQRENNEYIEYRSTAIKEDGSYIVFSFFDTNKNGRVDGVDELSIFARDKDDNTTLAQKSGVAVTLTKDSEGSTLTIRSSQRELSSNIASQTMLLSIPPTNAGGPYVVDLLKVEEAFSKIEEGDWFDPDPTKYRLLVCDK